MLARYLVVLFCAYFAYGQTPALKGWLLGWATDPNLPLLKNGNKSYYLGVHYKANFLQAMQFCDIVYMKLLTIESEEENTFIQKIVTDANQGKEYWTSGSRALDGKNWIWMSNGKIIEYTKWASTRSNVNKQKCLQLVNNDDGLAWNDMACDKKINFICQRDNNNEIQQNNNNLPSVSPNINLLYSNGKSYYFTRDFKGNFLQAAFFCRMLHMTLATINSEEENNIIEKYIRDTNINPRWWIAGSKFLDNAWTWFTNGQHVGYTNWQKGEPDNYKNNQKCLSLFHNKEKGLLWMDENCNDNYGFICERYDTVVHPRIVKRHAPVSDEAFMEAFKVEPSGLISVSYVDGKKFHVQLYLEGTQHQAAMFCDYHGMQLVSIEDKEKNEIIKTMLAKDAINGPYWTSGKNTHGEWSWGSNKPFSYANWEPVKTSYIPEPCIQIVATGHWQPAKCTDLKRFICEEKEKDTVPKQNKPVKKCSTQPIVNVYVNNNLVTEGAKVPAVQGNTLERQYTVDVTNEISSCNVK